jgi:multidrug efflux system membrane fusion protein
MPRAIFFIIICSAILTQCSAHVTKQSGTSIQGQRRAQGSEDAVPVSTATVVEKVMPVDVAAVGSGEAISTVQVRAQVTGQLGETHFAEGQDVTKDQLLFTLDPRPFELALQQADAVRAKDVAQANNAQAEVARYKPLLDRGLIPREQFDSFTANAAALQATTGADQAAVETARLNLEYTRIIAPISGRAGSLMVHPGDLIRANDVAPMVTINQMSPIAVTFAVPGTLLDDIRRYQSRAGLTVEAAIPGSAHARAEGRVTFIDNAVDPTSGTIKLKAVFTNANRELWPGLFVNVNLQLTSDPHALVAPSSAVQASQKGQYVYVVKRDQTVEMRPVTVSRSAGQESVIGEGLKNGETVVTDGQLRLTPGTRVTVRPAVFSAATQ